MVTKTAKSATNNPIATEIKKLTITDIIRVIKENPTKEWQSRWQNRISKLHEIKNLHYTVGQNLFH